jgi:hypothetical protein
VAQTEAGSCKVERGHLLWSIGHIDDSNRCARLRHAASER